MNFVVATDGSRPGERALEHALELVEATGGELTVVYAVDPAVQRADESDPPESLAGAEGSLIQEGPEDAEQRGQRVLEAASHLAADRGVDVDTELLYGTPVEVVEEFAADRFDQVLVGHRGLSEEAERVLGSTAKGLVERSSVPVTVVTID